MRFPCDAHLANPQDIYFRGIDVDARPAIIFRWLCQLRTAPYSYDWLDNFGRQSPRSVTPGLERLTLGNRFMTIFDLVDFDVDRHVTLAVRRWRRVFGPSAVTYMVLAQEQRPNRSS